MEITDKRLEELIEATNEIPYVKDTNFALKELQQLREKWGVTCNQMLKFISDNTKLKEQNKLLIADGERLAKQLTDTYRVWVDGVCDKTDEALEQHKELTVILTNSERK